MPNPGWYVVQDDLTLKQYNAYIVDPNGSTLSPLTVSSSGGGVIPGDDGGGDPTGPPVTGDWRTQPLFDPGAGKVVAAWYAAVSDLDTIGTLWGKRISGTRVYPSGSSVATTITRCQTHLNNGRVPFLTINWKAELKSYVQPGDASTINNNVGGTSRRLHKFMADGFFDGDPTTGLVDIPGGPQNVLGFIGVAKQILALGKGTCPSNRIGLTPQHEMDIQAESGFGIPHSPDGYAEYRASFARFRTVFEAEAARQGKASNVVWGFCGSTADDMWGTDLTDTGSTGFYPGHKYVDLMMWDPYNSAGLQTCAGVWIPGGRSKNVWVPFGINGQNGSSGSNTLSTLNGQMNWWWRHFEMGGAPTIAAKTSPGQGIYKPVWYGEYGTGEAERTGVNRDGGLTSVTSKQADIWFDGMTSYLNNMNPGVNIPIRGMIYFNNEFNNVTCSGSHRRAGVAGRGADDVYASVPA